MSDITRNREDGVVWIVLVRIAAIAMVVVTVAVVPWGTWVTSTLFARESRIKSIEDFKSDSQRQNQIADETLKLRIMGDVSTITTTGNERVLEKITSLTQTINEMKLSILRIELRGTTAGATGPAGATGAAGAVGAAGAPGK